MKLKILNFLMAFISLSSFAQTSELQIIPLKQPFILPRIELFGVQFGYPVTNFNIHLQADVNLNEKFTFSAKFDPSYWDMSKYILSSTSDNLTKLKPAKEYGVGFEMTLFTTTRSEEKKLIIKSEVVSQTYEYQNIKQTYLPVQYDAPLQTRLRGGLQGYTGCTRARKSNSNERIILLDREYPAIKAADGTVLNQWNPSIVNTIFIYGGLSFKRINYFQAIFNSSKQFGTWRTTKAFFFDVMFSPSIKVGDVVHANTTYIVNGSYKKMPFGFRIGQEIISFSGENSKSGMSASWEVGMLPGVGKFPVYAKMSIGFGLNFQKNPPVTF
jgi:hypothetical protein